MISAHAVNDGQWHTVTLASDGTNQSLFIDNDLRVGMAGSPTVNNVDPLNDIGAGVFPANTATKKWVNAPGDGATTRASYFTGQLANVVLLRRLPHPRPGHAVPQPPGRDRCHHIRPVHWALHR